MRLSRDLYPLTRIAPDDASHRRGDPTSPRKRGEVKKAHLTVNSTGIEKLIEPFLISSGIGGNGEKRTPKSTAQYAHHWKFVGGTPEGVSRQSDVLGAPCAGTSREPQENTPSAPVRAGTGPQHPTPV